MSDTIDDTEIRDVIAAARRLLHRSREAADQDAATRMAAAFAEEAGDEAAPGDALVALLAVADMIAEQCPLPGVFKLAVAMGLVGDADEHHGRLH